MSPTDSEREADELSWPASIHAARRFIMHALPRATAMELDSPESDWRERAQDPPVLTVPETLEHQEMRAVRVAPPRASRLESQFGGFLDGAQDVRVVNHCEGIPIVWATVSAAIRVRHNRRLTAWTKHPPVVRRRYYLPLRYLEEIPAQFKNDARVVDTALADSAGKFPTRHPAALLDRAIQKIQHDREELEQQLADEWCREESTPLYVDGSITGCAAASSSALAIGVVKSHRTLYGEGKAFRVVMGLEAGERTSVFRVAHLGRTPVASWYVRVRPAAGRDALFGLVRVEASLSEDVMSRADEVSQWVIAEGSPLALPDGRWDKMSYGIRDTTEFLRAIS